MDILFHINEVILLIYFVSLLALSYDILYRNRRVRRLSFYFTVIAAILQIIALVVIGLKLGRLPIFTSTETLYIVSLLFIVGGLIHYKIVSSEIALFINLIVTNVLFTIYTFSPIQYKQVVEVSALMNELLVMHVIVIIFSYLMFFVSALHSVLYLIQYKNLKDKTFTRSFFSIFSIETAQKVILSTNVIGILSLTIGIILGIQWGIVIIGLTIINDFKVMSIVLLLLCYILNFIYLKIFYNRVKFSIFNIILFIFCLINFIFLTQLSEFHVWN